MDKSLRIKANVGKDQILHINMKQNVDLFEVLSLTLTQKDAYKLQTSNYGVIVGRVLANDAFGVPNAKVSVFVPLENEDSISSVLTKLYPYSSPTNLNDDGIRYNLLPTYSNDSCYANVGTFPSKRAILDNDTVLEVYDKYYKFTTTTNKAGDYMIFGVPTGNTQLHVDVDLSDIGILSQKPRDFIYKGYNINQFDSPTKFKKSTNLDTLAQIYSQNEAVTIYPFWGDDTSSNVAITRKDINLHYEFNTTCVFLGSAITDSKNNSITHDCNIDEHAGEMSQLVTGEGTIEMIRKTPFGNVESFTIHGNQLIDSDGVWCYQIPMNLDYVGMDEYGNIVPTNDPTKGIATRSRVRFRFSLNENGVDTLTRHKAKILVPNNPLTKSENDKTRRPIVFDDSKKDYDNFYTFGSQTPESCFRDLLWNNVYTVKSYIPRVQRTGSFEFTKYSGIKGVNYKEAQDKNLFPYNKIRLLYNTTTASVLKTIKNSTKDGYFWGTITHNDKLPNSSQMIESSLEENNAISLDFYNDWVNGVLYFPLWFWRVRKKKKYKNGEIVYDSKFCSSKDKVKHFYNISTCDLPYLINNNNAAHNISIDLNAKEYKNKPSNADVIGSYLIFVYEIFFSNFKLKNKFFDKSGIALPLNNGLIVQKDNKDNAKVYYYSNSEKLDNDYLIRLYSTDIVLLGSLVDNDINGIPQIGDFYPSTTSNIPPMGSYKPNFDFDAISLSGSVTQEEFNKTKEIEKNDKSLITGMHWGYENEGFEKDNSNFLLNKGLFFGTLSFGSWVVAYSLPKTCINVERISELGVSLDMSTWGENDNALVENNFGINDGLITKREIEDEYGRQLFATLNQNTLLVSDENINNFTDYKTYNIKYCCPTDFDGKMNGFINDFTNGYSHDDESVEYNYFRFGGYKKYQFNYFKKEGDKNRYYFPAYNNSLYFYFGLHQGQTAIEKFKKEFYANCDTEKDRTLNVDINIIKTPTLCKPNDGEVKFVFNEEVINTINYTIKGPNNFNISGNSLNLSNLSVGSYSVDIDVYDLYNNLLGKISDSFEISYPKPLLSIGFDENLEPEKIKINSITMYHNTYYQFEIENNFIKVDDVNPLYLKYELRDEKNNLLTVVNDYTLEVKDNVIIFNGLKNKEYNLKMQEQCKDDENNTYTPVSNTYIKTIYIMTKKENNG